MRRTQDNANPVSITPVITTGNCCDGPATPNMFGLVGFLHNALVEIEHGRKQAVMKRTLLLLSLAVFAGTLGVVWATQGTGVIKNDVPREGINYAQAGTDQIPQLWD